MSPPPSREGCRDWTDTMTDALQASSARLFPRTLDKSSEKLNADTYEVFPRLYFKAAGVLGAGADSRPELVVYDTGALGMAL